MTRGIRLYNGHLREPVTLAPIAERLAVELSLPVLFKMVKDWVLRLVFHASNVLL